MTATGHAAVGTLIAARFPDPFIAIPLSLLSHIACDILPHWDSGTHFKTKTRKRVLYEAIVDVLISFVVAFVMYYFFFKQTNYVHLYANVLAAQFLDYISVTPLLLNMKFVGVNSLIKLQEHINISLDKPWGIVTQVVFVIGLYFVLFHFI